MTEAPGSIGGTAVPRVSGMLGNDDFHEEAKRVKPEFTRPAPVCRFSSTFAPHPAVSGRDPSSAPAPW